MWSIYFATYIMQIWLFSLRVSTPLPSEIYSSSSSTTSSSRRILSKILFSLSKTHSLFKRFRGCLLSKSFHSFSNFFHKRIKGNIFEISICLLWLKIIGVSRIKCLEKNDKRHIQFNLSGFDIMHYRFYFECNTRGSLFCNSRVNSLILSWTNSSAECES